MKLVRALACSMLLPGCGLGETDAYLPESSWLRVNPGWYCEGGRCGRAQTEDHDYYAWFSPDGRFVLAYPDVPFVRSGAEPKEKFRCRSGRWSLDGHLLTMTLERDERHGLDAEMRVRELWNLAGGSITATPIPGHPLADGLDVEGWEPRYGVLPAPTDASPCPVSYDRSGA